MATFYGSDTDCVTDIPLIDQQVTDPRVLIGQRLARMLQITPGALGVIGDDPTRGYDVRQLINAKLSPSTIVTAQGRIQAECLKDEQVASCKATITQSGGVLSIDLDLDTAAGTFTLTMDVAQLTTDLVFNFGS